MNIKETGKGPRDVDKIFPSSWGILMITETALNLIFKKILLEFRFFAGIHKTQHK